MEKASAAEVSGSYAALEDRANSLFRAEPSKDDPGIPEYLKQTYWWAYLHPAGVRFFERQWLVNFILWGNFARLRDEVLHELGETISGRILQVACVYGDFTPTVAARLTSDSRLDVIDVAPVQLENVSKKLDSSTNVMLHRQDSTRLEFQDGVFDHVVVFFLLHEQPMDVRQETVREALRVVKPGGKVIFTDYHRPGWLNPFRYIMAPVLLTLEPFAMDMWHHEITDWFPRDLTVASVKKELFFGGLYQKVVITR
ncbi:MAG: class I SAM-dependent methyltransferase [Magnetococcales bacterium]|nr:class I SAM-dependent methyltransferase [Magnetococcales bacterium]MBF0150267.1 class I SAM-dependent methyltransferase [Magnetococcales bacterium]MBF0172151.1 class I SAM-dependent methyltransferase [Magnetococcales bacterium]MBF0347951.1 class I SAM-dependent methyltransferase [Magnetococcales bacterium]